MEDKIKLKIEELEKAKTQTLANLNAIEGALNVLKDLVKEDNG